MAEFVTLCGASCSNGEMADNVAMGFIEMLQEEHRKGYGFVPFLGAGLSAASNQPLMEDVRRYLQRCIGLALSVERYDGKWALPWMPHTDHWPPFIDRTRHAVVDWPKRVARRLEYVKKMEFASCGRNHAIIEEGLGAMAEWRSSLIFLSRLEHEHRSAEAAMRLGYPRQDVIDSCFRAILAGKRPVLVHQMLARVAAPLRADLILTTNFDDLIERGFEAAGLPTVPFQLHLTGEYPAASAVSNCRALVKLHGDRYSLRADYSLDEAPQLRDRHRFLEYLASPEGRLRIHTALSRGLHPANIPCQNHLLVIGVGASEQRTLWLLEHAWRHMEKGFKVFWVCHDEQTVKKLQQRAEAFLERCKHDEFSPGFQPGEGRLVLLRHSHPGFLLLQTLQCMRRCLPSSGITFPSISRLPLPPLPRSYGPDGLKHATIRQFADKIVARIHPKGRRGLTVVSGHAQDGVTSACSVAFYRLEHQRVCLWLDMADIADTGELLEKLLDAANYRLGIEDWVPVRMSAFEDGANDYVAEIDRLMKSTTNSWVVFLNARDAPGENARASDGKQLNNWLDDKLNGKMFSLFVRELSQRMSVVVICRTDAEGQAPIVKMLKPDGHSHLRCPGLKGEKNLPEKIVAQSLRWALEDRRKRRFLHALALMQRTRYLSAIWCHAVSGRDENPHLLTWLTELESFGLVYRKPGGFIWLHSPSRTLLRSVLAGEKLSPAMRHELDALNIEGQIGQDGAAWESHLHEKRMHRELVPWYLRVIDASDAPTPVFEAASHACRAALKAVAEHSDAEAAEDLFRASELLRKHRFLIQTRGYSKASCRSLTALRQMACDIENAIRRRERLRAIGKQQFTAFCYEPAWRLQVRCTELMRAVAREVGEDRRAFVRQFELRKLLEGQIICRNVMPQSEIGDPWRGTSNKLYRALFSSKQGGRLRGSVACRLGEWVRWWRWLGMLGVASRSYEAGLSSLVKALHAVAEFKPWRNRRGGKSPRRLRQPGRAEYVNIEKFAKKAVDRLLRLDLRQRDTLDLAVETLRVIESAASGILMRTSCARRSHDAGRSVREKAPFVFADLGELLRHADRLYDRINTYADSDDPEGIAWCRCRLLMHRAILATETPSSELRWRTAMSYLLDARAALNACDSRRADVEQAVIDLHRVEVRLREASEVRIGRDGLTMGAVCRGEGRDRAASENIDVHAVQRAKALASDAMRLLDRAEPLLKSRRRNVWWTTWFAERKLRAIAVAVQAARLSNPLGPVPYLGLESCPRRTPTIADELLDDTIRMIRTDSYRMATVVEAYRMCEAAVRHWGRPDLKLRGKKMASRYRDALRVLKAVQDRRTPTYTWCHTGIRDRRRAESRASRVVKDAAVDTVVDEYISAVLQPPSVA